MKGRTKAVAIASSLLIGVSMIGVGFASWVIANREATDSASGNIKADSVSETSAKLEVTSGKTDQNIFFGAPANMETEGAWLTNNSNTTEDLTATFELTVSENIGDITVSLASIGYTGDDEFWKAVNDGYLAAPVVSISSGVADAFTIKTGTLSKDGTVTIVRTSSVTIADDTKITVTLTFGWGTKFGGQNPYTYYADKDYSTYHAEALTNLDTLYNYLNQASGLEYIVTFTAKA